MRGEGGGGGWASLSPLRPSRVREWRRMKIYFHSVINKGGIQRKHISLVWVGREEHDEHQFFHEVVSGLA